MNKIRVLFANHPVMVPDAIRKLVEEQDDMEVVGDCRGPIRILQEAGRANADAVIITQEGMEEPGLCDQLLSVYPDLTIMSVTTDMGAAFTQQLRSRRQQIDSVDEETLLRCLRAAVVEQLGRADK